MVTRREAELVAQIKAAKKNLTDAVVDYATTANRPDLLELALVLSVVNFADPAVCREISRQSRATLGKRKG